MSVRIEAHRGCQQVMFGGNRALGSIRAHKGLAHYWVIKVCLHEFDGCSGIEEVFVDGSRLDAVCARWLGSCLHFSRAYLDTRNDFEVGHIVLLTLFVLLGGGGTRQQRINLIIECFGHLVLALLRFLTRSCCLLHCIYSAVRYIEFKSFVSKWFK